MNRFLTGNRAPRAPERAEMLARVDPTLERPVILFQDVIEILHRAVLAVVGQIACGLEHGNGGWTLPPSRQLSLIDNPDHEGNLRDQKSAKQKCSEAIGWMIPEHLPGEDLR